MADMVSGMNTGDLVKTTAINRHFENHIARGHEGLKAEKGHYMVFLFLGTTKRDGTEPLDVVATVKEMGWTPDAEIEAQHQVWLSKHPDARTPFGPVATPSPSPAQEKDEAGGGPQTCGICGAFYPRFKEGVDRVTCKRCGTEWIRG